MSAVSVGKTPEEVPHNPATRGAREMAESVTVLGNLLAAAYTESEPATFPAGALHTLIAHVEQAISGLAAVAEPNLAAAEEINDAASSLQVLLLRLTAMTN